MNSLGDFFIAIVILLFTLAFLLRRFFLTEALSDYTTRILRALPYDLALHFRPTKTSDSSEANIANENNKQQFHHMAPRNSWLFEVGRLMATMFQAETKTGNGSDSDR